MSLHPKHPNTSSVVANKQRATSSLGDKVARAERRVEDAAVAVVRTAGKKARKVAKAVLGAELSSAAAKVRNQPILTHRSDRAGGVAIRDSEFIFEVRGNPTFAIRYQQEIRLGSMLMFPKLSRLIQNYEEYEIESLEFFFKSSAGTATVSQAQGSVYQLITYDSEDPPISGEIAFINYDKNCESKPWQDRVCKFNNKNVLLRRLYVEHGTDYSGDKALHSHGRYQLAVTGNQVADVVLGKVFVRYKVWAYIPRTADPASVTAGSGNLLMWSKNFTADAAPTWLSLINNLDYLQGQGQQLYKMSYASDKNKLIFVLPGSYRVHIEVTSFSASQATTYHIGDPVTANMQNDPFNTYGTVGWFRDAGQNWGTDAFTQSLVFYGKTTSAAGLTNGGTFEFGLAKWGSGSVGCFVRVNVSSLYTRYTSSYFILGEQMKTASVTADLSDLSSRVKELEALICPPADTVHVTTSMASASSACSSGRSASDTQRGYTPQTSLTASKG